MSLGDTLGSNDVFQQRRVGPLAKFQEGKRDPYIHGERRGSGPS